MGHEANHVRCEVTIGPNCGAGIPAYAPPEQLRGWELDVRADIYSVNAALLTLLTGKPPVDGLTAVEMVAAALEELRALSIHRASPLNGKPITMALRI